MEKETVLEIEFMQVWDKWAWRVTKFDYEEDIIKIGHFYLSKNKTYNWFHFGNDMTIQFYAAKNSLIPPSLKNDIETFVKEVNEKYGKPKRWRAEKEQEYWYVVALKDTRCKLEKNSYLDDLRYKRNNYFQTRIQAEQALEIMKKVKELREVEE